MTTTCEVWFYQLERSGLDEVLPELLEKTLKRGWRALVRSSDAERIEHIDQWLWTYRDDSFLPHAMADEPKAERQPILLTTGPGNPNGSNALFLIDGAQPGPLDGLERCIILFDGQDPSALTAVRGHWRDAKALGAPVSYWRQSDRGWEKQS